MLRFSGAGVSDVGLVREHNEDSAFVGPYVALVADGVGGAAAGEVASASAAYVVSGMALARPDLDPSRLLCEAMGVARLDLAAGVRADPAREGMATTMTAVVCDGHQVVLAHVGDSRAYLWREGTLTRVSKDHTYVQLLLENGQLGPEEVSTHPWRNVVLRSLQAVTEGDLTDADVEVLDVTVGDRLLLCSDGLTDLIDDGRIAEVLRLKDPHSAAAVLTQSALSAGGRDNVTCVVLDLVDSPRVVGDGRVLGALEDPRNVVDLAGVSLG